MASLSKKCKDDYTYFLEEFCLNEQQFLLSIVIALLFIFEIGIAVFLYK